MNSYDLYPRYPIRPGVGQAQGQAAKLDATPSAFTVVRTLPLQAANAVEYVRFNFLWYPVTDAVLKIAFGPADTAALDTALSGAPPLLAAAIFGVTSVLLQPTDTGFKFQAVNVAANGGTIYWWLG